MDIYSVRMHAPSGRTEGPLDSREHRHCVVVCFCRQETKDTLDKEALYRCMASCFEAAHVRYW